MKSKTKKVVPNSNESFDGLDTATIDEAIKILRFCARLNLRLPELKSGMKTKIVKYLSENNITGLRQLKKIVKNYDENSLKLKRFIPVLREMQINDIRTLKSRLQTSEDRLKGLRDSGTENQKKCLELLEKGTTMEEMCEKMYNDTGRQTYYRVRSIIKGLIKGGVVIYSMGRGLEAKYQLKPFGVVEVPYVPPIPKVIITKDKDYDKLMGLFKFLQHRQADREKCIERFGDKFDGMMEVLMKNGLAGAHNRSGRVLYFTNSGQYEFDAKFLKKVITDMPEKFVGKKIFAFIQANPGCTRAQIAEHVYGSAGHSQGSNQSKVSMILHQSLKDAVRFEKKGQKCFFYADAEYRKNVDESLIKKSRPRGFTKGWNKEREDDPIE
jgi:hypothetical protein